MKSKVLLAGIMMVILAAACTLSAELPGEVVLKPGETASHASGSITVTFVEVREDSRCPADAVCVWAGQVKVLLEVAYGTETQQYTLTLDTLLEGDVNSVSIGGVTITLVQVDPYPLASQPADPADYRITLDIE